MLRSLRAGHLVALAVLLAVAAVLGVVLGGSTSHEAGSAPTVVYDAIPSPLPWNMPSVGFEASETSEFGDDVHLGGADRGLRTVTVTMSDWALSSSYPSMSSSGWNSPITLNIYSVIPGTPLNTVGSLLATKTQTFTIPWRPEADPTCPGGTAWRASDGSCYNGFAFNITFDLSSLNVTLPNDIVVGVAYDAQHYGYAPTGTSGPYNSLNVGAQGLATVGTDDNANNVFWNSANAPGYADGGAGGVGKFREDTNWAPYGTLPMQITAVSTDADLASLALSSGTLSPAFSPVVTSYTASVDDNTANVIVSTTTNPAATAVVTGGSNLAVGSNTVTITVTAEDGTTVKTYTVTVTRAAAPLAKPSPPTGVAAIPGDGQVAVWWSAPDSDGGSPITGYTVTASPGGETCTWPGAAFSCVVTGLADQTAYTFQVTATNALGTGSAATLSAPVTPTAATTGFPTAPGPPTSVSATPGNGQATVSWSAPDSDGGSPITGYTVTASPGGGTCTWSAGPLVCAMTGLTDGTPYTFQVTATNDLGISDASAASVPVTPAAPVLRAGESAPPSLKPAAPADLIAHLNGATLAMRWHPGSGGGAVDHYLILRNGTTVASTTRTRVSIDTYEPDVPNHFEVIAVDAEAQRGTSTHPITVTWAPRPRAVRALVPSWAWQLFAWQQQGASERGAKPHVPARLPAWYAAWETWRLNPHTLQES